MWPHVGHLIEEAVKLKFTIKLKSVSQSGSDSNKKDVGSVGNPSEKGEVPRKKRSGSFQTQETTASKKKRIEAEKAEAKKRKEEAEKEEEEAERRREAERAEEDSSEEDDVEISEELMEVEEETSEEEEPEEIAKPEKKKPRKELVKAADKPKKAPVRTAREKQEIIREEYGEETRRMNDSVDNCKVQKTTVLLDIENIYFPETDPEKFRDRVTMVRSIDELHVENIKVLLRKNPRALTTPYALLVDPEMVPDIDSWDIEKARDYK